MQRFLLDCLVSFQPLYVLLYLKYSYLFKFFSLPSKPVSCIEPIISDLAVKDYFACFSPTAKFFTVNLLNSCEVIYL